VRTGELRRATPEQFDLERGLWIIPPGNVKQLQRRMHKLRLLETDIPPYLVPLSRQALEIVRELLAEVTPSQRYLLRHRNRPEESVCPPILNDALRRLGYANRLTGHGLRGTLSTALNEIGYPQAWIEAQLSHADPNSVRGACNHAEYVEQRRRMMQDWADRLDCLEQGRIEEAGRHLIVHLENVSERPVPEHAPQSFVRAA
jgi:integrase